MLESLNHNLKVHWSHYVALMLLLLLGFGSFIFFRRYPQVQLLSVFLTATLYVVWGIIHHHLEGDLHIRIVLEYVAVALLGFLICFTLISRV